MLDIKYHFEFIRNIREFFYENDFVDIVTPPLVQNPGMEPHIHPFQAFSIYHNKPLPLFLQTSPEFTMKRILAQGSLDKISTIGYAFRDEPHSSVHREQFIMCEWYKKNEFYFSLIEDCKRLILKLANKSIQFLELSMDEVFDRYLGFKISEFLDYTQLRKKINQDFPHVPIPDQKVEWDDLFFLLFLNEIEPHISKIPYLFIHSFPSPLAALSTINKSNPNICDRFELYANGVEIANAFNELTDFAEQKRRFENDSFLKKSLYHYQLPYPQEFMDTLEYGLPKSCGIALGVERLYGAITGEIDIFFT